MVLSGKKKPIRKEFKHYAGLIPGHDLLVICLGGMVRHPTLCLVHDLGEAQRSFVDTSARWGRS